jgi:hypothetical protein
MQVNISIIKNRPKLSVLVKTFYIYDISNKQDQNVIELEKLLAENPSYTKHYWQQQGPCSNWGYDVFRPETDEEYNNRLEQENRQRAQKRQKALLVQ